MLQRKTASLVAVRGRGGGKYPL